MPREHLPQDWVVAWAAGTLPPAEGLLCAAHLTLCPACRQAVEVAECGGAAVLAAEPEVALDPSGFDALLARLDEPSDEEAPPAPGGDGVLPWPVLQQTGPLEGLAWQWLAPWTYGVDLDVPTAGLPLRLVRMSAGAYLPHRHQGAEIGLILQGGWSDAAGHHGRGDLAFVEVDGEVHHQRIDADQDCIALVLNEAVAVPAVPFGRWLARFLRT